MRQKYLFFFIYIIENKKNKCKLIKNRKNRSKKTEPVMEIEFE